MPDYDVTIKRWEQKTLRITAPSEESARQAVENGRVQTTWSGPVTIEVESVSTVNPYKIRDGRTDAVFLTDAGGNSLSYVYKNLQRRWVTSSVKHPELRDALGTPTWSSWQDAMQATLHFSTMSEENKKLAREAINASNL